ncbi:hypothetical protein HDU93_001952 [Gonapodya sp. JEL0774]|nr:hypothetical protein HDU93_001952 [Gonapodya sp. JEL0774]
MVQEARPHRLRKVEGGGGVGGMVWVRVSMELETALAVSAMRTAGADLEELMLVEAVRRSLLESEMPQSTQAGEPSGSNNSASATAVPSSLSSAPGAPTILSEASPGDSDTRPPLAVPSLIVSTYGERKSTDTGERTPTRGSSDNGWAMGLGMTRLVDGALEVAEGGEAQPGTRQRSESQVTAKEESGVSVSVSGIQDAVMGSKEAEAGLLSGEVAQAARG